MIVLYKIFKRYLLNEFDMSVTDPSNPNKKHSIGQYALIPDNKYLFFLKAIENIRVQRINEDIISVG